MTDYIKRFKRDLLTGPRKLNIFNEYEFDETYTEMKYNESIICKKKLIFCILYNIIINDSIKTIDNKPKLIHVILHNIIYNIGESIVKKELYIKKKNLLEKIIRDIYFKSLNMDSANYNCATDPDLQYMYKVQKWDDSWQHDTFTSKGYPQLLDNGFPKLIEKQEGDFCGVHSINNFLQETKITEDLLVNLNLGINDPRKNRRSDLNDKDIEKIINITTPYKAITLEELVYNYNLNLLNVIQNNKSKLFKNLLGFTITANRHTVVWKYSDDKEKIFRIDSQFGRNSSRNYESDFGTICVFPGTEEFIENLLLSGNTSIVFIYKNDQKELLYKILENITSNPTSAGGGILAGGGYLDEMLDYGLSSVKSISNAEDDDSDFNDIESSDDESINSNFSIDSNIMLELAGEADFVF